ALFLDCQASRKNSVGQERFLEGFEFGSVLRVAGVWRTIVFSSKMQANLDDLIIDTGVEPSLRPDRWHKGRFVEIGCLGRGRVGRDVANLLSVCLLNHSESAKLALDAVKVPVVILVAGYKPTAADTVVGLHSLNAMNSEW